MNNDEKIMYNTMYIERKKIKNVWSYIILLVFVILITVSIFCKYELFYINKGIITKIDNSYYIKLYAKEEDLYKINNNTLFIDNVNYSYKIKKISNDYILDNNTFIKYKEVLLSSNIKNKYYISNNVIDIKIKYKKIKLIKHIYNNMFGKGN
ncbi:MAG: hypothetical protein WDA21_01935 [Bacilli bacterium]